LEVAHPVICVEDLTGSLSEDAEVTLLTQDLELGVSKVLGVSLSEVQAQYFWDSDEGEDSEVDRNLVEEQNYGNVILNHIRSGWY
jgi:hypothetical protein